MKKTNLFTLLTKLLVVILPFYVVIKVFFELKLGIPKFGFLVKELVLVVLILTLAFNYYKDKKIPKLDILDYLIFSYIGYGIIITLVNGLGLKEIIYGGRYDFIFLVVFLIFKHSGNYLKISFKKLATLGLISMSLSLVVSIIISFRLGEEFLLPMGFMSYTSDWTFNGSIPNYHGLENSGLRRFGGILDGPNAMGYFLILFSGLFIHLQKKKNEYYVYFLMIFIFILVLQTYSRSAMVGIIGSSMLLFILNFKNLITKYRDKLYIGILLFITIVGGLGYVFQDKLENVVLRASSTSGHFERMAIGLNRFIEKPLGSGLSTSGPAFRSTYEGKITKEVEAYYIPESWYIQVLTEGGIIFLGLFLAVLIIILVKLYPKSRSLFWAFGGICLMNVFLHIFEATYLSILLFLFIGVLLKNKVTD